MGLADLTSAIQFGEVTNTDNRVLNAICSRENSPK
jgi:hypothetical protein